MKMTISYIAEPKLPRIALVTLCLNEYEHLPKLYEQHKEWPGLVRWVFVEAADIMYVKANPNMVSEHSLSIDQTSIFLRELATRDDRVKYIPFGLTGHDDVAQGKCAARTAYLEALEPVEPDYFIVVDADEFYVKKHQQAIIDLLLSYNPPRNDAEGYGSRWPSFCLPQRHIWRPESIVNDPEYHLFSLEVRGGFWSIPHCRLWRWQPGLRYVNDHNTPMAPNGHKLNRRMARIDKHYVMRLAAKEANTDDIPQCIHMGFASNKKTRAAKHRYYETRGEGTRDHRAWYVASRAAFECWKPSKKLPNGAQVIPYTGLIPEVFQRGS